MTKPNSPLDQERDYIESLVQEGRNRQEIVASLASKGISTSERSIRRALKRWTGHKEKSTLNQTRVYGDEADITSDNAALLNNPTALIEERGLDPEDWTVDSVTMNEWDSPSGELMKQLKIHLRRKRSSALPEPARSEGWKPPKSKKPNTDGNLVALLGDQHAPHHDEKLHELVVAWLADNKPHKGILLGDLLDFPEQSRHRHDPAWKASAQTCIDSGYRILCDYLSASPDTEWEMLLGNHEIRIRNTIIDVAQDLYGIRPGTNGKDNPLPSLSLNHLLRLDELGIKLVQSDTSYEYGKIVINKNLAAIHGHIATKGSGTTARKALTEYGHSLVQGHSHRASIIFETVHDIEGNPKTLTAAESGCLCKIKGGLGYTTNPDWQQGFCTATVHSDNYFKLDLATHLNGKLLWRHKEYE